MALVVFVAGREIAPGDFFFSDAGYAYRLVRAVSQTTQGYSAGAIVVRAVGYDVDGGRLEGAAIEHPADALGAVVRRV